MTREDAEAAQQVPAGWRYRGNQAEHEIFWRKHDGARAVFPAALQSELERAVGALGEPGADTALKITAFRVFRCELRDGFAGYTARFVSIDVLLT